MAILCNKTTLLPCPLRYGYMRFTDSLGQKTTLYDEYGLGGRNSLPKVREMVVQLARYMTISVWMWWMEWHIPFYSLPLSLQLNTQTLTFTGSNIQFHCRSNGEWWKFTVSSFLLFLFSSSPLSSSKKKRGRPWGSIFGITWTRHLCVYICVCVCHVSPWPRNGRKPSFLNLASSWNSTCMRGGQGWVGGFRWVHTYVLMSECMLL